MAKPKRTSAWKSVAAPDWTGIRTERVDYSAGTKVFRQGEAAASIFYLEKGAVRLSVVSQGGREAVIALLEAGHFFGEGCLAGQSHRMATATAALNSTALVVDQQEMVRQLFAQPRFADRF